MTLIGNYIHLKLRNVMNHPWLHQQFSWTPLRLSHEWLITSQTKQLIPLPIHVLICVNICQYWGSLNWDALSNLMHVINYRVDVPRPGSTRARLDQYSSIIVFLIVLASSASLICTHRTLLGHNYIIFHNSSILFLIFHSITILFTSWISY